MLFSIIVPVYNVAEELSRAIDSVKAQTYRNWELVLVDDGSTDGSSALCDEIASCDDRMKVIHQLNQGVVVARQVGFENTKGDWILFLDADDMFAPTCLAVLSETISDCSCDIVQYGYNLKWLDGKMTEVCPILNGNKTCQEVLACTTKTPLSILGMCLWNKCYKRKIAEKAFGDVADVHISHSEDGLFAFAAFLHADKIAFSHERLYSYILRQGSALRRVNVEIVEEKEMFISRLNLLAMRSCRMETKEIQKMCEYHAYESCCYIFLMLSRNHANLGQIYIVLRHLKKASFFQMHNCEINSLKRKLMYALLSRPLLYAMASKLGVIR